MPLIRTKNYATGAFAASVMHKNDKIDVYKIGANGIDRTDAFSYKGKFLSFVLETMQTKEMYKMDGHLMCASAQL